MLDRLGVCRYLSLQNDRPTTQLLFDKHSMLRVAVLRWIVVALAAIFEKANTVSWNILLHVVNKLHRLRSSADFKTEIFLLSERDVSSKDSGVLPTSATQLMRVGPFPSLKVSSHVLYYTSQVLHKKFCSDDKVSPEGT